MHAVQDVEQVYFDDEQRGGRYLVVDTGGWLGGRKVLISPRSIDRATSSESALGARLSRRQMEQSPEVDTEKPVSRQYEEAYAKHYGFPLYWAPPEGAAMPAAERAAQTDEKLKAAERRAGESHLRSSGEVIGYSIQARDAAIGHVEDLRLQEPRGAPAARRGRASAGRALAG